MITLLLCVARTSCINLQNDVSMYVHLSYVHNYTHAVKTYKQCNVSISGNTFTHTAAHKPFPVKRTCVTPPRTHNTTTSNVCTVSEIVTLRMQLTTTLRCRHYIPALYTRFVIFFFLFPGIYTYLIYLGKVYIHVLQYTIHISV